jgi:hypothetical protein
MSLVPFAFVAGPLLMTLAALSFVSGIGLIPPGKISWVEGILGAYGIVFFVPIYLELSRRLSATHRRLARVTTWTGLFGATAGFAMEFSRVFEYALRERGAGDQVWSAFYANPGAEFLAVALLGPLFPLTSLLLGIGFWRARTEPRWVAASLIAAGIGFPLAQVGELQWALHTTYPAACGLWLCAGWWLARRTHGRAFVHP